MKSLRARFHGQNTVDPELPILARPDPEGFTHLDSRSTSAKTLAEPEVAHRASLRCGNAVVFGIQESKPWPPSATAEPLEQLDFGNWPH
jgi:hypothetical protein